MAVYQIKTFPEQLRFRTRTRLGTMDFVLDFDWNETVGAWYLSINDSENNPVVGGQSIRLILNYPLNRKVNKSVLSGWLIALELSESVIRLFYND